MVVCGVCVGGNKGIDKIGEVSEAKLESIEGGVLSGVEGALDSKYYTIYCMEALLYIIVIHHHSHHTIIVIIICYNAMHTNHQSNGTTITRQDGCTTSSKECICDENNHSLPFTHSLTHSPGR